MNRRNTPAIGIAHCRRWMPIFLLALVFLAHGASSSFAEIIVGTLTKEKAKEKYGITMHAQKNGDAGIKVWLQFKKEGWLEKFTYAKLEVMDENEKPLISAMLKPLPIDHRQSDDVTTVAFSADASQLPRCRFLVVCYGSNEGDVGYTLAVKDFLDLKNPITAVESDTTTSEVDNDDQLGKLLELQGKDDAQNWDAEKCLWLGQLVLDLKAIKVGSTRGHVDKVLVSDGPTRTAKAHRYQHPKCPFLKLDVFFDDVESDFAPQKPGDAATRVHGPLVDLTSNWVRW